jgi:predicted nucleic acid-binding protein
MRTALDTNILSALWSRTEDSTKVAHALGQARLQGALVISGVVYCELRASPLATGQFIEEYLESRSITVDFDLHPAVWRLAAAAFSDYAHRRRNSDGGNPKRLLPDFLVGAHARLQAEQFLTLDQERYTAAFPDLNIVVLKAT